MTVKDGGSPQMASPPTLETVAAEAGVSRATVSRVVNGDRGNTSLISTKVSPSGQLTRTAPARPRGIT